MAKGNSLSNEEVAIVKNLLNKGIYSNQAIAGFINRSRGNAQSDVNGGRISNIKYDQIKKYKSIAPASESIANEFLKQFSFENQNEDPLSDKILKKLLPIKSKASDVILDITETDIIECKKNFNIPSKTVAAFANNKGGYFVCGVENSTWKVLGLTSEKIKIFSEFDLKTLSASIRTELGCDLQIKKRQFKIAEHIVGIVHVSPAQIKPVIFVKNVPDASEGHIYYRYPGEDRLISFQDLHKIIEERIRQLSETVILSQIQRLLKDGPANAAILDTNTGLVEGPNAQFIIDESLLPKLTIIKEGQFTEKKGQPTLKLVGDLLPVAQTKIIKVKEKDSLVDRYPYTYREMFVKIKSKIPNVKEKNIQDVIKNFKIKNNEEFSGYVFKSKSQAEAHKKTGRAKNGTPSIYNDSAISFIISKINK